MEKQFKFIINKTDINQYGINGALLLADLRARKAHFMDAEMLNDNDEFFTTLQDIQCSTKLGINTIKRLIPQLSPAVECEVRKDRITKHTKEQITYYFKFPTKKPNGLVNTHNPKYISKIAGMMTEQGYQFLLSPIPTENIEVITKFYKLGFTPKDISEEHMMGKIHTIEQLEAIYEVYGK